MLSKLFGTDSFMELLGTPTFWYTIIILIGVIALLVACIRYWKQGGNYALLSVFTLLFAGVTAYSIVNLNAYYSARGGIHGAITGIFQTNEIEYVNTAEYKITNTELTQIGETDTYSATIIMDEVFALDKDVDYMVYVNNMPCTYVENASDYVIADYKYTFYDDNFVPYITDTLNFRFAFYTNSTSLKISTNGGAEALKYWHHYFNKNTFIVKIKEVKSLEDFNISFGTGDISNYCTVSYSVNGEITNIQVYTKGQTLNLLEYAEGYNTWLLNDEIVENEIVLTENITLVAEKFYNVNFNNGDEVYQSLFIKAGYISEEIESPTKENYDFIGWSIDGESVVDVYQYHIEQDVSFIALWGYWESIDSNTPPATVEIGSAENTSVSLNIVIFFEEYWFNMSFEELKNIKFELCFYVGDGSGVRKTFEINEFNKLFTSLETTEVTAQLSEEGLFTFNQTSVTSGYGITLFAVTLKIYQTTT